MNFLSWVAIAWVVAFCWSVVGTIFFLCYNDEVSNPKKRIILRLISGPFVWIVSLGFKLFGGLFIAIDDLIVRFINWLRSPGSHMEDNPECQFDEATDARVKKFAHDICNWIYDRFPDYAIELSEDIAFNSDHTLSSNEMSISTDLGVVIVLPDFRNKNAAAIVVNLGIVQAMMKEGFEMEYIEKEGRIYSDPIPFTSSTVEVLGYYLTHRLNLIK